jgi:glucan phosphoethanolaminetransferase (alkaline phosphatase superfamily)
MKSPLEQIWPSIAWTAIVFFLLSMDTSGIGGSGFLNIKGLDKLIHFVLFFAFAALWFFYFKSSKKTSLNWLLFLVSITGSLYGLAMEFYQDFFTNRSFSYWDAVADAIGAAAGAVYAKKSPYGNRGRNQN